MDLPNGVVEREWTHKYRESFLSILTKRKKIKKDCKKKYMIPIISQEILTHIIKDTQVFFIAYTYFHKNIVTHSERDTIEKKNF